MKKSISLIIAAVFTIIQTMLPLQGNNEISELNRLLIAAIFLLIWIIYIVFSDKIEYFISKIVLGKNLVVKSCAEKYNEFYTKAIPQFLIIERYVQHNSNENVNIDILYNCWCNLINFIIDECCIARKHINYNIVYNETDSYVADFRKIKIDKLYIKSIITILRSFYDSNNNSLAIYNDLNENNRNLEKLEKIFGCN